jgi:transcriptional regulator with XRE-family HTH domain
MSSPHVHSYLRTHRRKWALTQKELIFLLGRDCASSISRLEQGKRTPGAATLLACEVLFGITPRELFPKLYLEAEEGLLARAAELYEKLERDKGPVAARKRELLDIVLRRAITRVNNHKEHES